ncbi:MAG: DUF3467 domain-containing protein [Phycisphaerae bacterium]|jgi:hypothetical protein
MIFGEEDSQQPGQPQGQPQQVRLDVGQMETVYANSFAVAGSAEEIVLHLGTNLPMPGLKQPVVKITHRVALLPANAKRLMIALQQTMKAHEDRFGPIELPPPRRPDVG